MPHKNLGYRDDYSWHTFAPPASTFHSEGGLVSVCSSVNQGPNPRYSRNIGGPEMRATVSLAICGKVVLVPPLSLRAKIGGAWNALDSGGAGQDEFLTDQTWVTARQQQLDCRVCCLASSHAWTPGSRNQSGDLRLNLPPTNLKSIFMFNSVCLLTVNPFASNAL